MQGGEPYSYAKDLRTGKWRASYTTFKRIAENVWQCCGHCFLAKTKKQERIQKMRLIYKVLYYGQKTRSAQLRECLEKQKMETERYKQQAELFYNSYMSECDAMKELRKAFVFSSCMSCGEEIVLASHGNKLNYCPKCGKKLYINERISERM